MASPDDIARYGPNGANVRKSRGLQVLEIKAVRCGGGVNHRLGLDDGGWA